MQETRIENCVKKLWKMEEIIVIVISRKELYVQLWWQWGIFISIVSGRGRKKCRIFEVNPEARVDSRKRKTVLISLLAGITFWSVKSLPDFKGTSPFLLFSVVSPIFLGGRDSFTRSFKRTLRYNKGFRRFCVNNLLPRSAFPLPRKWNPSAIFIFIFINTYINFLRLRWYKDIKWNINYCWSLAWLNEFEKTRRISKPLQRCIENVYRWLYRFTAATVTASYIFAYVFTTVNSISRRDRARIESLPRDLATGWPT